jgi:hypothetical protein
MVLRGCKAGDVNVGAGARALQRPDFLSSTVVLIKPLLYRGCLVFLIPIEYPLALVELVYKGLY